MFLVICGQSIAAGCFDNVSRVHGQWALLLNRFEGLISIQEATLNID